MFYTGVTIVVAKPAFDFVNNDKQQNHIISHTQHSHPFQTGAGYNSPQIHPSHNYNQNSRRPRY